MFKKLFNLLGLHFTPVPASASSQAPRLRTKSEIICDRLSSLYYSVNNFPSDYDTAKKIYDAVLPIFKNAYQLAGYKSHAFQNYFERDIEKILRGAPSLSEEHIDQVTRQCARDFIDWETKRKARFVYAQPSLN